MTFAPGPFAEANARYQGEYEQALDPTDYTGLLTGRDQYDGVEDNYIGTTWDVLLDETRGRIAMVELEDVLKRFDGKRVRITIEEVNPQRPAERGEGSTTP